MTAEHRDSRGRALTDYPRPSVAVDTAVLTYHPDDGLLVLQVRRATGAGWALPGTWPRCLHGRTVESVVTSVPCAQAHWRLPSYATCDADDACN